MEIQKLSPKAAQSFREATARINIWEGAVRSGKTIASILAWIDCVLNVPVDASLLMVGKTERTLSRNILDVIGDIVGAENFRYNRGLGECTLFGRKIYVVGANDERAEQKIRGLTIDRAYGDEVTLWAESFFRMLLSRLSTKGAKLYATTNPDSPYHWLKEDYLDRPELDLRSWHFKLEDNPSLDPLYVQNLKMEYTGIWYQRFIEGAWVMAEGVIYDMWNEEHHVAEPPEHIDKYSIAIDYGTATVMTFGLYGERAGLEYLIDEYYHNAPKVGRQKTDGEFADDLDAFVAGRDVTVYIDPSASSFIQELRRRGYTVIPADNTVIDGIRTVSKMLANRHFYIAPGCKDTIKEFASYVWDTNAQEKGEDKPRKMSDHAMDRNRYYLYTKYGKNRDAKSVSGAPGGKPKVYRRGDLTLVGERYVDKD